MSLKLCILGAGPGGYTAAVRAAQRGAEVTLVEKEQPGGTCLNWGCIPSKVLITTAELYERLKRAASYGIAVGGEVQPDLAALQNRKAKVVGDQIEGLHKLFQHHRIRYLSGTGCITAPGILTVTEPDGQAANVAWDRLILATGTRPATLPGLAFDGTRIISSNDALSLKQLPSRILIVGGGVIGCEFAHIFSAFGVQVTVVEALDRLIPIPSVDADISKVLLREMKKRKVRCLIDRAVTGVEDAGGALRVAVGASPLLPAPPQAAKPETIEVDQVLVSVGRTPNTDGIGLEHTGVKTDARGWVEADEAMCTADPRIFAIGDLLGPARLMLAHAATAEGQVAASSALGEAWRLDYGAVPNAIFTAPEMASVGLSQVQALEAGIAAEAATGLFRTLGKAQVLGEIAGEAKVVWDAASGRIVGVHLIGPHATELIAEATLLVKQGLTLADLADTIHAHPTLAEIMLEVAYKGQGRALHA